MKQELVSQFELEKQCIIQQEQQIHQRILGQYTQEIENLKLDNNELRERYENQVEEIREEVQSLKNEKLSYLQGQQRLGQANLDVEAILNNKLSQQRQEIEATLKEFYLNEAKEKNEKIFDLEEEIEKVQQQLKQNCDGFQELSCRVEELVQELETVRLEKSEIEGKYEQTQRDMHKFLVRLQITGETDKNIEWRN